MIYILEKDDGDFFILKNVLCNLRWIELTTVVLKRRYNND